MNSDDMRITPEEKKSIEDTFGGNDRLLKLLRKIFLPAYDPNAPIGQTVDLWSMKDITGMAPEEAKIYFLTRQQLILHVEAQLMQLKVLAKKEETVEDVMKRMQKDSSK